MLTDDEVLTQFQASLRGSVEGVAPDPSLLPRLHASHTQAVRRQRLLPAAALATLVLAAAATVAVWPGGPTAVDVPRERLASAPVELDSTPYPILDYTFHFPPGFTVHLMPEVDWTKVQASASPGRRQVTASAQPRSTSLTEAIGTGRNGSALAVRDKQTITLFMRPEFGDSGMTLDRHMAFERSQRAGSEVRPVSVAGFRGFVSSPRLEPGTTGGRVMLYLELAANLDLMLTGEDVDLATLVAIAEDGLVR